MITCPHCGSKGRIMVQTVISAPSDLYRQFSKKNLRSKDVRTHGTLWETCDFICGNEACGRVTNGYGNYVTNLKKENEQLKAGGDLLKQGWNDGLEDAVKMVDELWGLTDSQMESLKGRLRRLKKEDK